MTHLGPDGPTEDGPTFETFDEELDTVIGRHNDLLREHPGYGLAMILQTVDFYLDAFNVEIDVQSVDVCDRTVHIIQLGPSMGLLNTGLDPDVLEALPDEIDRDLLMLGEQDGRVRQERFTRGGSS